MSVLTAQVVQVMCINLDCFGGKDSLIPKPGLLCGHSKSQFQRSQRTDGIYQRSTANALAVRPVFQGIPGVYPNAIQKPKIS